MGSAGTRGVPTDAVPSASRTWRSDRVNGALVKQVHTTGVDRRVEFNPLHASDRRDALAEPPGYSNTREHDISVAALTGSARSRCPGMPLTG